MPVRVQNSLPIGDISGIKIVHLFSQSYAETLRRFSPTNHQKMPVLFSAAVKSVYLHANVQHFKHWSIKSQAHYCLKKSIRGLKEGIRN